MEEIEMKHNFTVTKTLIAGGDHNPIKIYEGTQGDKDDGVTWGNREAAIKRIPKLYREKAIHEARAYMELDQMPKILRCFGAMEDENYCYIALERAGCSLDQFIWAHLNKHAIGHENDKTLTFLKDNTEFEPWTSQYYLHPISIKIIKDVMEAVSHLHKKGIKHLNITPENILLFHDGESGVTAKLANFTFHNNSDGLSHLSVNDGTEGWRCAERLKGCGEGLSSDIFSLALVIFYLVCGGAHPFGRIGDLRQCEENIKLNKPNKKLEVILRPVGFNFLKDMLADEPTKRPQVETMLSHPLLWDKTNRANFLCELNNMIRDLDDKSPTVVYLNSFQNSLIPHSKWGWQCKFFPDFLHEVANQNCGFKYGRFEVRELLRFVRNMLQHYNDYSKYMGSSMDSAYAYLLAGIPELIVIGYNAVKIGNHAGTDRFKSFFCS